MTTTYSIAIGDGRPTHAPDALANRAAADLIRDLCRGRAWTPAEAGELIDLIAMHVDPPLPTIPATGALDVGATDRAMPYRIEVAAPDPGGPHQLVARAVDDDSCAAEDGVAYAIARGLADQIDPDVLVFFDGVQLPQIRFAGLERRADTGLQPCGHGLRVGRWRSAALGRDFCCPQDAAETLDVELRRQCEQVEAEVAERIGDAIIDRADTASREADRHARAATMLREIGHAAKRGALS